jgi:serine/threonine-protein kinase
MGQVYLAEQVGLNVLRAVKIVSSNHQGDTSVHKRFRREAQTLSRLHHDHIVQIHEFGQTHSGELYIVMEYIEGATIQRLIDANGPMDLASGLRVLRDLSEALRYAHHEGVVHRDLKPGNIILRQGDASQSKIIDFGLVRVLEDSLQTKLTRENQVIGSPLYLSPEQGEAREDLTGAADVYALAGIAYFLLSGAPVFQEAAHSSLIALVLAHLHAEPEPLGQRCTMGVPAFLETILLSCLAKEPEARPSAEELVGHFDRLLRQAG